MQIKYERQEWWPMPSFEDDRSILEVPDDLVDHFRELVYELNQAKDNFWSFVEENNLDY